MSMNNQETICFNTGVIIGIMIGVLGCAVVFFSQQSAWRQEAIQKGYAKYEETTGEWMWRKNPVAQLAEKEK
jgi:hypothetical protein